MYNQQELGITTCADIQESLFFLIKKIIILNGTD